MECSWCTRGAAADPDTNVSRVHEHDHPDSGLMSTESIALSRQLRAVTPIDQDNIFAAVALYCSDATAATLTYGPIESWDTSAIVTESTMIIRLSS